MSLAQIVKHLPTPLNSHAADLLMRLQGEEGKWCAKRARYSSASFSSPTSVVAAASEWPATTLGNIALVSHDRSAPVTAVVTPLLTLCSLLYSLCAKSIEFRETESNGVWRHQENVGSSLGLARPDTRQLMSWLYTRQLISRL